MMQDNPFSNPDFVRRTLTAYSQQIAGLAAVFTAAGAPGVPGFDALRQPMIGAYQQLFTPAGPGPLDAATAAGAAFLRWQRASERQAALLGAIAQDAFARFLRALEASGPGAPPITSIAALHALWIDCGEAAWAEAAHREDFAEAQAELLAALAGVKSAASRR